MKVGIFIQTSPMPLYQQNTKLLLDFYTRFIQEHNLDMDVYAYQGEPDIEYTYSDENHMLHLKCDDRNVKEKHRLLFEGIRNYNHSAHWDAIIKTNTNVVLDLEYIRDVLENGSFKENVFYTVMYMSFQLSKKENLVYPNGNFYFFSTKILDVICNDYEKTYEELTNDYNENTHRDSYQWKGIPEDIIVGKILYNQEIQTGLVVNPSFLFDYVHEKKRIDRNSPIFITRILFPFESRIYIEPTVTEMCINLIETRYKPFNVVK